MTWRDKTREAGRGERGREIKQQYTPSLPLKSRSVIELLESNLPKDVAAPLLILLSTVYKLTTVDG
jgi:hypothetical protein